MAEADTLNKLMSFCRDKENVARQAYCLGYISGIADVIAPGDAIVVRACVPRGVTRGLVHGIVANWLETNPSHRHYNASALVAVALSKTFPCKP